MAKFREIIVKSINVQAGKYTDINDQLQDFLAHEIYLVPKEDGEHDRYVVDKNFIVSKQSSGASGNFVPISGTEPDQPLTGRIVGSYCFTCGDEGTELDFIQKKYVDESFIPIIGTEYQDQKITGALEFTKFTRALMCKEEGSGATYLNMQPSLLGIETSETSNGKTGAYTFSAEGLRVNNIGGGESATPYGIRGGKDYTPFITDLDYVQKKYVDEKFISLQGNSPQTPLSGTIYASYGAGLLSATEESQNQIGFTNNSIMLSSLEINNNNDQRGIFIGYEAISVFGSENSDGIRGYVDFSPNLTDLSYVQKTYVDNAIENASGGDSIPLTGTELNKPLIGNVEINNNDDYFQRFYRGDLSTAFNALTFEGGDFVQLQGYNQSGLNNFGSKVSVGSGQIQMTSGSYIDGVVGSSTLVMSGANITISNNGTTNASERRGLRGEEDFTSNIQSLDYVQKIYVDDKGIPVTLGTVDYPGFDGQDSTLIVRNGIQEGELAHMRIKGTWTINSGEFIQFSFENSKSVRIGSKKITLFNGTNLRELIVFSSPDGSTVIYNLGDTDTFSIDETLVGWYTEYAA